MLHCVFLYSKLSGNSFACEDLEESLTLLCSEDWQELIDGISCTDRATRVNNNNTTYPERSLRELCNSE